MAEQFIRDPVSEAYLEHYGKKGMKWGTRKETKTVNRALTPKAHAQRLDAHNKNPHHIPKILEKTDRLVIKALMDLDKPVTIVSADKSITTFTGREFAENVIGRVGNVRLNTANSSQGPQRVTLNGRR